MILHEIKEIDTHKNNERTQTHIHCAIFYMPNKMYASCYYIWRWAWKEHHHHQQQKSKEEKKWGEMCRYSIPVKANTWTVAFVIFFYRLFLIRTEKYSMRNKTCLLLLVFLFVFFASRSSKANALPFQVAKKKKRKFLANIFGIQCENVTLT